ncbi:MAG: hypothetical protein JWM57_4341 [Phycisphaerales bacterium]|nr:hypothetical protein [Phycisphaerales bacterium]
MDEFNAPKLFSVRCKRFINGIRRLSANTCLAE